jgi:hypothetical protein
MTHRLRNVAAFLLSSLALTARALAAPCVDPADLGIDLSQQAECDPLVPERCLLPFPSDYFTVPDGSTHTHRRVQFSPNALPSNTAGTPLDANEIGQSDGFSPGSALLMWMPTVDLALSDASSPTSGVRSRPIRPSSSSTRRPDGAGRSGPSST